MTQKLSLSVWNRREFLKVAVPSTIFPFVSQLDRWNSWRPRETALRVGILLPGSTIYPPLAKNLLAGMHLLFEHAGQSVDLTVAEAGKGYAVAQTSSWKLLEAGVDMVVAFVNSDIVPWLTDIYEVAQRPLLVANEGANVVRDPRSPFIFYNSLNGWQASWTLGQQLYERQDHRRAYIATSVYDSGYDALYAFKAGFEAAGGTVVQTHLHKEEDLAFSDLLADVASQRPDVVYGAFSGPTAARFLQAYFAGAPTRTIPLATAPLMLLTASANRASSTVGADLLSCTGWTPGLATEENRWFMTAYEGATGRAADLFAVLGYETAALIMAALGAVEDLSGPALATALETVNITTPRGRLTMDPESHMVGAPLYLTGGSPDAAHRHLIATLENISAPPAAMPALKTGWLNPYLCL